MKITNKRKSLAFLYPQLKQEWDYQKNKKIDPFKLSPFSKNSVFWHCKHCGKKWKARPGDRIKSAIPRCICHISFAKTHPKMCMEWHPTKNKKLTPYSIRAWSRKLVWWKCNECGYEWKTTIMKRCQGYNNCFRCKSLGMSNDRLSKEWHPTKNGKLTPYDVLPGSSKRAWWQHVVKGQKHEWISGINSRSDGNGCPCCSGLKVCRSNCLATKSPKLSREWHPTKNGKLTPYDVTNASSTKIWWKCDEGHEWKTEAYHRNDGNGCPECNRKSPTTVTLVDGTKIASKVEAYWYLIFKKYNLKFEHDKKYKGKLGSKGKPARYDFYFPDEDLYVEITSYQKNNKNKRLKKYWQKIRRKEAYVKNKLCANFVCIFTQLTKEEYEYVEKYLK